MYKQSGVMPRTAILAVGFSALIVAIGFLAIRIHRGIGDFQLTHYYFNYSEEFLRRGLIGELLRLLGLTLSNINISVFYSSAVVLFLVLLVVGCAHVFARLPIRTGVGFVVFMLACPGLTLHYAYSSYGYLDVFQLLLAVLGLVAIRRQSLNVGIAVVVVLTVSSMLIHEAGLMITAPVLIAALMLKHSDQFTFSKAATLFAFFIAVAIVIWRHGSADMMSFEDHIAALSATAAPGNTISDAAVVVLHRTLGDNVGLLLPQSPWWYAWQQIKFFVLASPYLYFFLGTLMMVRFFLAPTGRQLPALVMAAAIFAPVTLYAIGHDYFRWWSASMTNYFLLMLFFCSLHPAFLDHMKTFMDRRRPIMLAGILVGITMGGIGGLVSFSPHTAPAFMAFRAIF